MAKTLEDILEVRPGAISGAYEVVRTVGFSVATASGTKECRLEVIRPAGQPLHEVLVTVRDGFGAWRRDPYWESGAAPGRNPDEALRVALEHIGRKAAEAPAPAPEPEPVVSDELSPEIVAVLSAAVAAFCGKTARIRGARLIRPTSPSSAWAQQGRASIQGSHYLARG